jgi:hypothetical protein
MSVGYRRRTGTASAASAPLANQLPANLMTTVDPRTVNAAVVIGGANRAVFARVVAPSSGFLRDMTVATSVSSGNIDIGIYDLGETTPNVRTRLGHSGSIACPSTATNPPIVAWDPGAGAIAVVAGRSYDFALAVDNNTCSFVRAAPLLVQLPANYWAVPGGVTPKLCYVVTVSAFPLPASVAESDTIGLANCYLIMGRISPT